jgi:hypothetical protein
MTVKVIGPLSGGAKIRDDGINIINTTSSSNTWSSGLSPFFLGPIKLYSGAPCKEALRFENLWQFSKVYDKYDNDGEPNSFYFDWARRGFLDEVPRRYPMGKGAKPKYSFWAGEKLSYIEARRKIYIPHYRDTVYKTDAYKKLEQLYKSSGEITLWCYDGYLHREFNYSYEDVINNKNLSMGHGFVLAMMLENYL